MTLYFCLLFSTCNMTFLWNGQHTILWVFFRYFLYNTMNIFMFFGHTVHKNIHSNQWKTILFYRKWHKDFSYSLTQYTMVLFIFSTYCNQHYHLQTWGENMFNTCWCLDCNSLGSSWFDMHREEHWPTISTLVVPRNRNQAVVSL